MWKNFGRVLGCLLMVIILIVTFSLRSRYYVFSGFHAIVYYFEFKKAMRAEPVCSVPEKRDECFSKILIQNGYVAKTYWEFGIPLFYIMPSFNEDVPLHVFYKCIGILTLSAQTKNLWLSEQSGPAAKTLFLEEKNDFAEMFKKQQAIIAKRILKEQNPDFKAELVEASQISDRKLVEFQNN